MPTDVLDMAGGRRLHGARVSTGPWRRRVGPASVPSAAPAGVGHRHGPPADTDRAAKRSPEPATAATANYVQLRRQQKRIVDTVRR